MVAPPENAKIWKQFTKMKKENFVNYLKWLLKVSYATTWWPEEFVPQRTKTQILFTKREVGKDSSLQRRNFPRMAWIHANFLSILKRQKWSTKAISQLQPLALFWKSLPEKMKNPVVYLRWESVMMVTNARSELTAMQRRTWKPEGVEQGFWLKFANCQGEV